MSRHKVVGDLSKPLALFLIVLAAQGVYFVAPRSPLMFSPLEVSILAPCEEVYPVQVTLDGHPLTNLEEANFEVSVNDQPVQFKLVGDRVIDAMILLDTSGSMASPSKIESGKNMTRFVVETAVRSGGKSALITFNDETRLEGDWTRSPNAFDQAIDKLQGSGSTRLWDAIKAAAPHLQAMHASRPCELTLLVVISDFEDTASLTSEDEAVTALEGTGAVGIPIVYGSYVDVSLTSADHVARATGGRYLRASEAKEAISQLQRLLDSIYYLEIKQRGHIKITVTCTERTGSDEIDS